ncbi:hypothetical protein BV22DRAFT_1073830 [Leucogyrophana mollusca]|uniref:Uncharacterized protein n=1 Tax=Leucogyrophana mollusca TaxID=85980 RepID=A0ACB8B4C2_9AGAM|nr:hypothetical protein BV22DRAFT_1073830 [Leucogyrophana mollusca]
MRRVHRLSVLAIYSQGGGKSAPHSWQHEVKSIGAVSYLAMQVYEYAFLQQFRAVHHEVAKLQAFTFTHLPSDQFLWRLHGSVSLTPDGRMLDIGEAAFDVYSQLRNRLPALLTAAKSLSGAQRKGADNAGGSDVH